jgi:transposase
MLSRPAARGVALRSHTSAPTVPTGSRPWSPSVCPDAVACADPFHVVGWATEALDEVRRQAWNAARRAGHTTREGWSHGRQRRDASGPARALKHARYALWKNPEPLTENQQAKLAWIAKTDPRLHRAYLLKEALRTIFQLPAEEAAELLEVSHAPGPRPSDR